MAGAAECSIPCPSGFDSQCPVGMECMGPIEKCNMFCGPTLTAAASCSKACITGRDSECDVGESCLEIPACSKYCGPSLSSAASCSLSCVSGLDKDCPVNEKCFAVDTCTDPEGEGRVFYCADANDPNLCRAAGKFCGDDASGGCGSGEYCFYGEILI